VVFLFISRCCVVRSFLQSPLSPPLVPHPSSTAAMDIVLAVRNAPFHGYNHNTTHMYASSTAFVTSVSKCRFERCARDTPPPMSGVLRFIISLATS
jgi:hypothetical protein